MGALPKILIVVGIVLILGGLALFGLQKFPFFGKLPGDFLVKRDNFTFYFPLTTSIILSLVLSLVLYLIGKFR
jgi:hypothetical protein